MEKYSSSGDFRKRIAILAVSLRTVLPIKDKTVIFILGSSNTIHVLSMIPLDVMDSFTLAFKLFSNVLFV